MYMNGRQAPSKGLSPNNDTAKTCNITHQTLFSGFGIHHGNTCIEITPVHFMKESFMLICDLTRDGCTSEGHISLPGNGTTHFELKFEAPVEAATILLFQDYDASIKIKNEKRHGRFLNNMDTLEIYHVQCNMYTFSGVFHSFAAWTNQIHINHKH